LEFYSDQQLKHYKKMFHELFQSLNKANPAVIDVGCGTGYVVQFLLKYTSNITAIDISENMLAIARQRFPQIQFEHHSWEQIKDSTYDMVTSNAFLHHLFDYDNYLLQICKLIKKGGAMFIGYEPNALAFRIFKFPRKAYKALFTEERVERAKYKVNSNEDIEKLAEYHQYFSDGISPRYLKNKLLDFGFQQVRIIYSNIGAFGNLTERTHIPFLTFLPSWFMRAFGPFSLNFCILATQYQYSKAK
jgi:ubiquinone/menaquinone biosynthesis C-methylase UbiE